MAKRGSTRGVVGWVLSALLIAACGGTARPVAPRIEPAPGAFVQPGAEKRTNQVFQAFLEHYRDADYARLERELGLSAPSQQRLSFDPTRVKYYDRIVRDLKLTKDEQALYAKQGLVSVDHGQRYSMGSAYYAIYSGDLPVLVTTDSILHALHRSYDESLKQLELALFIPTLKRTLTDAHSELSRLTPSLPGGLKTSATDLDLYLSVALSLLDEEPTPLPANVGQVGELLAKVASLELQTPDNPTSIYGGKRPIDFSQFKPRGHYTESVELSRYFRAMMWLGRADSGFVLQPPDPRAKLAIDAVREARDAALLTLVLQSSGATGGLSRMRAIIDFLVGRADSLTVEQTAAWLKRNQVKQAAQLADDSLIKRMAHELASASQQQIRSQVIKSPRGKTSVVPPPEVFQIFGQSFVLDSFVLAQVVFDAISFEEAKQERMMPMGLDVMAALGNDEAVRLLRPELEKWKYSANLLAARKAVEHALPQMRAADLYHGWLGVLSTLDDAPKAGAFPEVMRSTPWHRKQLQTQLASWAELRHDTILYAKQSYTAYPDCEYPAGYVEPYPAFFDALEHLATRAAALLAAADVTGPDAKSAAQVRDYEVKHFQGFAETMRTLSKLAQKELSAQPFTEEEASFLKKTIDRRGGGSGPPRYDGWYPNLIYGGEPAAWQPTIADVHTDPANGAALEVGVGDVEFVVVAIDNQTDRAAYVGPIYSYFEFPHPAGDRLTDEQWEAMLHGPELPSRPGFTSTFRAPRVRRELGPRAE